MIYASTAINLTRQYKERVAREKENKVKAYCETVSEAIKEAAKEGASMVQTTIPEDMTTLANDIVRYIIGYNFTVEHTEEFLTIKW